MKITQIDRYIKVSDIAPEILNNLNDFDRVAISATINCEPNTCLDEEDEPIEIPVSVATPWKVDLTTAVSSEYPIVREIFLQTTALIPFNILTEDIDLGYVSNTCTEGTCTLETFSDYFKEIFEAALDSYFLTMGITVETEVSFEGNVMIVDNIPQYFQFVSVSFGSAPYLSTPFFIGDSVDNVFFSEDAVYIRPEFFDPNRTTFQDGIYSLRLRWYKEDSVNYVEESNCAFIDITTKCRVAATLNLLLQETKAKSSEEVSITVHVLHYALVNGSNCNCNCAELCQVFYALAEMLDSVNPQILSDCGC